MSRIYSLEGEFEGQAVLHISAGAEHFAAVTQERGQLWTCVRLHADGIARYSHAGTHTLVPSFHLRVCMCVFLYVCMYVRVFMYVCTNLCLCMCV